MLHDFLTLNRTELITRCEAKATHRNRAPPTATGHGIPKFLEQLIATLHRERTPAALARPKSEGHGRPSLTVVPSDIAGSAALHGDELRRQGFTIDQVVHDYGDLCQAMTELAIERDVPISADDFHTFNRCLDDAIADAVTAFSVGPTLETGINAADGPTREPVAEMRNLVETAILSFAAMRAGQVGLKGTTSSIHERSLERLRDLLDGAGAQLPHAIISPAAPR